MKNTVKKTMLSMSILMLASSLTAVGALAQTLVVKSENVVTNTNAGVISNGVLVVKDGKIVTIDKNREAKGDKIFEGKTLWVTPGIFAPFTHLGLVEVSAERASNNTNAADHSSTVRIRAVDSFNPKSGPIAESRIGGVTYAVVVPGAKTNIFGGQGMIVSTNGSFNSSVDPSAFVYVDYNGSSTETGGSKGAAMAYLRDSLSDAANFQTRFKRTKTGDALKRADAFALRPVITGKKPLLIKAEQAVDLLNIIGLTQTYPRLRVIFVGASEGWMVADKLAAANVGVLVDPLEDLPYSFDTLAARSDNVKRLMDAGVTTGIINRSATGGTAHNLRLMPQHAGNAVAAGLSWDQAFKAITLTPASLFGHKELGELKVGEPANFVVWNGDPLEVTSAVVAVVINGKLQSNESRQTKLRDRYNPTKKHTKPYGYEP